MRILFIFPRPVAYDSRTVRDLPSGGTEKAVIFLGEAFQRLGHDVQWMTTLEQMQQEHPRPDVVITQHAEFLEQYPDSLKIWWVHHFSDQPIIKQQAVYGRCFADKVVTLSSCQQGDFAANLRLDSVAIGHGVWLEEVAQPVTKDPYRLIYASTPFRGLERVPDLFRAIKAQEPRATIAIASSMSVYGDTKGDEQYKQLYAHLASIPGVELLGALNQAQLYAEFAKASIFFYPCSWPETYCLVMDEAIAHGCRPFVSNVGALPERACHYEGLGMDLEPFSAPVRVKINPRDWLDVAQQWQREVLGC